MPIANRFPFLGRGGNIFNQDQRRGGLQPFPMEQAPESIGYPTGGQPNVDIPLPIASDPLWEQARERLSGILSSPREKTFSGPELTVDQIAHNRDLETRLLPSVAAARIHAESTKGLKDYSNKEARSQKLSNRLSNIEKQMQTVHSKKDMAGNDRKLALRDLANQHAKTWDILDKHDPDSAAMHSKYNPETGQPEWYVPEGPGFIKRGAAWTWDKWMGLNEYVQDVVMDKAAKGEWDVGASPEDPFQALQMMDTAIRKKETPEVAQQIIDDAKAAAPMTEGADPQQVAEARLDALEQSVGATQERPVAPKVTEQLAGSTQRRPGLLERFQANLPTNEEYIQGGGMPGMVKRGIFGKQPTELEKYYGEQRKPGLLDTLSGLDKQVERALGRAR